VRVIRSFCSWLIMARYLILKRLAVEGSRS
jgi:hypothetical protein